MPNAVGDLELNRHEGIVAVERVEAAPVGEHIAYCSRVHELRQKLVEDHPLVVPGRQTTGRREHVVVVHVGIGPAHQIDGVCCGSEERRLAGRQ